MARRTFGSIERRKRKDGTYKPNFYAKFVWKGQRYVRSAGPTRSHARSKLDSAHGLLMSGVSIEDVLAEVFGDFTGTRLSFADAVPLYLEYASTRKRQSTFDCDVRRFRVILRYPWTREFLANVRTDHLTRFVTKRLDEGTGPATINRTLALVSAVYKWANRLGYCEGNPAKNVERLREPKGREVYLTASECRALRDAAPEAIRPLLEAAYSTGLRKGELRSLCWSSVDLEAATIAVEATKAKSALRRVVPLPGSLTALLRRLNAERKVLRLDGRNPVFVQSDGSPWTDNAIRRDFDKAKRDCEAVSEDKLDRLRWHDLRHSYASMLVAEGVPLFDVARLLGHGSLTMTMRYAHFQPESARRATNALDRALDGLGESHPGGHLGRADGRNSRAANE